MNIDWIYKTLNNVSRSFSFVIKELPVEIRDCVAVFYLILRALDTIEDDMEIDIDHKIKSLEKFYLRFTNENREPLNYGKGFENKLMLEFDIVHDAFNLLPDVYKSIIIEITKNMSDGMIKYINKQIESVNEYNDYCFYVAGLVGIGLSKIFVASNLEKTNLLDEECIIQSMSMGIFLQKTNIIRDFYEDLNDERVYWPKEIYNRYVNNPIELLYNNNEESQINSICLLNEMIENALKHFPDCLKYILKLENRNIIIFCSIPQIMALATLNECYNNINVFSTNPVKISREISGKMLMDVKDNGINSVLYYIKYYLKKLEEKMVHKDIVTHCLKTLH